MNSKISFTAIAPLVFDGINYQVWVVRMKAYLYANNLWEAVEQVYEVSIMSDYSTIAEIKNHIERRQRTLIEKSNFICSSLILNFLQNNDSENSKGNLGFSERRIRRK